MPGENYELPKEEPFNGATGKRERIAAPSTPEAFQSRLLGPPYVPSVMIGGMSSYRTIV